MIKRFLTNLTPYTPNGALTKLSSFVIEREDEDVPRVFDDFNICDYECAYTEKVLVDLVDASFYKNDKTSLRFTLSTPSDTLTLKLFKDCVEVATLNDATYGTVFDTAYFGDSLRKGFIINWRLVADALGYGMYHIESDRSILNQASTLKTHNYEVMPFTDFNANGTVKIQTYSSGYIEGGNDYDGTGFYWVQQIRVIGKLGNPQATFETDNYLDTTRQIKQIQDEITTVYDLEVVGVPKEIGKPLIYDKLLANRILITDYNLFNYEKYENLEVYPTEISESTFFNKYTKGMFKIKFTDKKQNIIKRNF